ncbi:A-kinase anchor protein 5 [Escherichia phage vB_EcoP-611R6]|nr:A-kinase anchor protein 5 [Escherichia phage vB_EcoP-611R6]
MMVTSPGPGLFSHQRFLTVLRFQPVAVKMSRYRASVLPNPSFTG